MKKLIILLLTLTLILGVFISCDTSDTTSVGTSDSETTTAELALGSNIIVLPVSKKEMLLDDLELQYWDRVDGELLKAADQKILDAAKIYPDENYYVWIHVDNGDLFLSAEFIVDIDPTQTLVDGENILSGGCNIDHKHIYVDEKITVDND